MRTLSLIVACLLLGLSIPLAGQLSLRKLDNGKIKSLKAGGDISLEIPLDGMGMSQGHRMLEGKLDGLSKGLLRVIPEKEKKTIRFSNGLSREEESSYLTIKDVPAISLSIDEIETLGYRSKGAEKSSRWGGLITLLGAVNALVVAPLASIDYGNSWDFNSDNYYRWAGYSLGATGLGTAILIGTKKRRFHLKHPNQASTKPLWTIEK